MHLDEIREIVKARPFKIFEIHTDNGEKYVIKHPENIFITPHLIITIDEQEKTIIIAPEAISTICFFDGQQRR